MSWTDVAKIVGAAAPIAGTLLTGPAGVAVAIGGMIANALGSGNSPEEVVAAMTRDPEATLKLAMFEGDNRVKLQELAMAHASNQLAAETAAIQAAVEDRKNARASAVSGGTSGKLFWLSVLLLVGSLGSEVAVLFVGYPASADPLIVGRVLGLMDSVALMVLAYNFGTTTSSARKTELLAQATPPVAAP